MLVCFAFFCAAILFNAQETVDNLRKYGGFLPGIRPGAQTSACIDYVFTRMARRPSSMPAERCQAQRRMAKAHIRGLTSGRRG